MLKLYFLLLLMSMSRTNDPIYGTVNKIIDGASFNIIQNDTFIDVVVTLYCLQPSTDPLYANISKEALSKLILNKVVKTITICSPKGCDGAEVFVNEMNIGKELIEKGYANSDNRKCRDRKYNELARKAKRNKIGIWSDEERMKRDL